MNCNEFLDEYDRLLDSEAGRDELPPERAEALRLHRESCALCRWEVRQAEAVARRIRRLAVFEAPPVRVGASRTVRVVRRAAAVLAASAAILVLAVLAGVFESGSPDPYRLVSGVLEASEGGPPARAGSPVSLGLPMEAREGALVAAGGASLGLAPSSEVVFVDSATLRIERGGATAFVPPGSPMRVVTPLGHVDAEAAAFTVAVANAPSSEPALRVHVEAGSVRLGTPRGTERIRSGESMVVGPDGEPVREEPERADSRAQTVARMQDEIESLQDEVDGLRRELDEQERLAIARSDPTARVRSREEITRDLDELERDAGYAAYLTPRFRVLAAEIRRRGAEAAPMLIARMQSEREKTRFLAAALATEVDDDEVFRTLAALARLDESPMVRRCATHSLAVLEEPHAGAVLRELYTGGTERDVGVLLNAWYGLARLRQPEAFEPLERLLDSATPDITEDTILSTVLVVRHPALNVSLREAFSRPAVSDFTRRRILNVLAEDPDPASRAFLVEVSSDPDLDPELRNLAFELVR